MATARELEYSTIPATAPTLSEGTRMSINSGENDWSCRNLDLSTALGSSGGDGAETEL
jgi:hypothetical protein